MNAHDMNENDRHAFVDGQLARGRHHKMVVHLALHPAAAERVRVFVLQREGLAALRDSLADDKVGEPLIKLGRALDRMVRQQRDHILVEDSHRLPHRARNAQATLAVVRIGEFSEFDLVVQRR